MGPIALVIAELNGTTIRRVTLEAIAVAQRLLQQQGAVHCFLSLAANHIEAQHAAKRLLHYGVANIYVHNYHFMGMNQPSNEMANELTEMIVSSDNESNEQQNHHGANVPALASLAPLQSLINELKPSYVVAGHTAYGRELAPRLAAAIGSGYIADVTEIQDVDSETSAPPSSKHAFIRPIYAGKAFEARIFQGDAPHIVTIRPNNHQAAEESEAALSSHISEQGDRLETALVSFPPTGTSLRLLIKDTIAQVSNTIDLTEADIIVAGGRGVRGSEGFELLHQLADQLGGAVGASRAACDARYCDYSLQIGQTGKVVTPQLYIACGISGAIQHLAGMSQSRTIVAINKDPDAPIFSVADYGIVGDLFEIVPLLIEELQAQRQG